MYKFYINKRWEHLPDLFVENIKIEPIHFSYGIFMYDSYVLLDGMDVGTTILYEMDNI